MKTLKNPQPPRIPPSEQALMVSIRMIASLNR